MTLIQNVIDKKIYLEINQINLFEVYYSIIKVSSQDFADYIIGITKTYHYQYN